MSIEMDWLNQNNGAVIALATVVGVLVAACYAWFTWGLWEETRGLARQAERQADITQHMLEAGYRPWLSIETDWAVPPTQTSMMVDFILENHGAVPARVTRWRVEVRHGNRIVVQHDTTGHDISLSVFPRKREKVKPAVIRSEDAAQIWGSSEHPSADAMVEYQGLSDQIYWTHLIGYLVGGHIVTERQEVR